MQNFPWFLQCRMLSVQGTSTSHPVLETESTCQTQTWPEGQGRAGCKQGLPQSRGGFLAWGSSGTGGRGARQEDVVLDRATLSCLILVFLFSFQLLH